MQKNRTYSPKTIKLLYGQSSGCCNKCHNSVISNGQQIGEIAHIYPFGEKSSPRYQDITKDGFDIKNKNEEINLILLCPTCHSIVDAEDEKYTAKILLKIKEEHINLIKDRIINALDKLSCAELDVMCNAIIANASSLSSNQDYTSIDINEKILKNNLSINVQKLITEGLTKTPLVHQFLNNQMMIDFSDKLLAQMKDIYTELSQSYQGDELFTELMEKINAGYKSDFLRQAAGLSVITYFFHICEIFER